MSEQSNFSQLTDEGVEHDTDVETAPDDSTPGSSDSASADSRSTLTEHVDSAVESWVNEREDRMENYGYFHLYVVAKSDLTGVERQLRYEEELDLTVSEGDTNRQYGGRWGQGEVHVDEVRDRLIDWKLGELATPYHPELRTVSAGNLRLFVAEPARELLRDHDVEIDTVVEVLNRLDEREPTDEQLATRREHRETYESITGVSASLKQCVRAIEETVRARFGFSARYGGTTPDPHPEYEGLDPTALKDELESARDEVNQAEQRKDELSQEIAEEEAKWIDEKRAELFE